MPQIRPNLLPISNLPLEKGEVLTKDEASFFNLSTTSSVAFFKDDALDLPKEPACESRDFRSKTNTETAFPVDFFFASYIFQGPEEVDGEEARV
jgi:hypothetical protein